MKLEIDLNDILFDEDYGPETLKESVQRQVIESVKRDIAKGIKDKIDEKVNDIISEEVLTQVKAIAPGLLNGLIDLEYQPVTEYGTKIGEPTTLRKKFIDVLKKEFIFDKSRNHYDQNAFTRAVCETVQGELNEFKKQYNKKVDDLFLEEALNYAVLKMKERLKIN